MFCTQQRRALIVIDVQNEHVNGKFTIEYPPVESSLFNIAKAMDAAAQHNVPVVVVAHVLDQDSPIFAYGSDGVALHPSVAKPPASAFYSKNTSKRFFKDRLWPMAERELDRHHNGRRLHDALLHCFDDTGSVADRH